MKSGDWLAVGALVVSTAAISIAVMANRRAHLSITTGEKDRELIGAAMKELTAMRTDGVKLRFFDRKKPPPK